MAFIEVILEFSSTKIIIFDPLDLTSSKLDFNFLKSSLLGAIAPSEFISIKEGREIFHLPELSEQEMLKLMEEKSAGKKEENNDKNKENGTDNDN